MNKHIELLKKYNAWRRGSEIAQPHPKDIGEALDYAIGELECGGWIKCSDELPENDNYYLAVFDGETEYLFFCDDAYWCKEYGTKDISFGVTHWQPLPTPQTK